MQSILARIGSRFGQGSLEFRATDGRVWTLGQTAPKGSITLHDPSALPGIVLNPALRFPESYLEGAWDPADGDLLKVLEAALRMAGSVRHGWLGRMLGNGLAMLGELNNPLKSRRNVHAHYDLDYDLYSRFLDRDLHYSCAYFSNPDMGLEAAQQAKCAHIAAKLDLQPGARVLDIGCGWGSMALYLAEHFEVRVTGITLSPEQLRVARQRALERKLERLVQFRLEDYRDTSGEFDAIVSIGMFEHVGRPQYNRFFEQVRSLLAPQGTALLHSIGRTTPAGSTNPWIRKYIFPGGYIPAASEIMAAMEPSGLILTDLEVWRLHYARTLAEWNRR
ncbi:MAG: class I SAM-dependent methyltransferase, partial [Nevskia sp.]|nr:class I SAM-dependent methyltransferase [Nevskia sp.]